MWKSTARSSSAADSRKDSRSSIPTWWSVSVSPLVALRLSTATRCRQLSTSPIASPSMPKPRQRCPCSVPQLMWDWEAKIFLGQTDCATRLQNISLARWKPTESTSPTSSTIRPISIGGLIDYGASTSLAMSRTTTILSSPRAERLPLARLRM